MNAKQLILIIGTILIGLGIIAGLICMILFFSTQKDMNDLVRIPCYEAPKEIQSIVLKENRYLGHPDLIRTDSGKILCVFPNGHGKGAIMTKTSNDNGKTWNNELENTPESWANSQETPIVDKLEFNDGSHKYILTSGCPSWGNDPTYPINGFNCSISNDGENWSEFKNWYGIEWANNENQKDPTQDESKKAKPFDCIVAMASLTKLKDANGNFIDQWMGIFHDHKYINYKTILSFENGKAFWSKPVKLLEEHRTIEESAGLCEIECIRGNKDNSDTLALICRTNTHKTLSMISISKDEGKTWSEPKELALEMSGERHKATYDPISGKIVMSFRQLIPGKTHIFSDKNFIGNQWVAWVGDFTDLLSYTDNDASNDQKGDYVLVLGKCNKLGGLADTGYSGNIVDQDGNFILASYGRFDKTSKNPFIMSVRFNLNDIEKTFIKLN